MLNAKSALRKFPNYIQIDIKDCGPTALRIISKFHGKSVGIEKLRDLSETTREGSNLLAISDLCWENRFRTLGAKLALEDLTQVPLPCILHWNGAHYVVLYKIKK